MFFSLNLSKGDCAGFALWDFEDFLDVNELVNYFPPPDRLVILNGELAFMGVRGTDAPGLFLDDSCVANPPCVPILKLWVVVASPLLAATAVDFLSSEFSARLL